MYSFVEESGDPSILRYSPGSWDYPKIEQVKFLFLSKSLFNKYIYLFACLTELYGAASVCQADGS